MRGLHSWLSRRYEAMVPLQGWNLASSLCKDSRVVLQDQLQCRDDSTLAVRNTEAAEGKSLMVFQWHVALPVRTTTRCVRVSKIWWSWAVQERARPKVPIDCRSKVFMRGFDHKLVVQDP